VVAATQVVARQLALPQGAPVVRIQRVRLGDGIPLSFDQTYLPKELGEKVSADHIGRTSSLASLTRHHISGTRPFMFPRLIWPNATPSGNLANALTRQRRHSSGPKMLQFDLEQVRGFGATGWEMAVVFGCSLKMIQRTRKQTESGA
jgi:hypothetical protein